MIQPAPRYRKKDIALIQERSRASTERQFDVYLPLSETAYQILLALSGPALTDDRLAELIGEQGGLVPAGTLRSTLARLADQGLAERQGAPSAGDHGAEPVHRVTELGYAVLLAESGRRRRGRGAA